MTRSQMIESIMRLIAPPSPADFRHWLERMDDAELEREFRDVCGSHEPEPALTASQHNAFLNGRWT